MDKIYKRKIIKHLRALGNREIKPKNNGKGICGNLMTTFKDSSLDALICHHSYNWSKYSGYYIFPVPNKVGALKAYINGLNIWDARTTYGRNRLELCLHIANELEKELKSNV